MSAGSHKLPRRLRQTSLKWLTLPQDHSAGMSIDYGEETSIDYGSERSLDYGSERSLDHGAEKSIDYGAGKYSIGNTLRASH